ncbi:cadherin-like beta sandwich domain-containing protein [Lachnospiraceae bacterium MD1]|uniref:Cadherin-like beta sandwich domain-containing protein n=1 Tax=Variimorphobacter saccharofermentans TaxID=2755051 RepID=A0A839K3G0_9FIRM|nr:cadherin-like beta sandwich domain-containing protein [Variimorphobacter saccharofermentans]MBB2184150.1 cadherin-like beta sandwich domain-containing protein [Variimorphobacter saccharofermentans]
MRKSVMRYLGIVLLILLAGGFASTKTCKAASAEVELTADTTDINVGDSVFVYINIKSDELFTDFEAYLSYDSDILEYQSGANIITGSSGFLKISDMGYMEGTNTRKYTLKFEALKAGTSKIAFSDRVVVYDYETGLEMSVSSNVLTLEVKAQETASTNANLKSLKILPSELEPAFDTNIFEYNVKVDYEIETLIINALPEDPKATVSISGNDSLKEGENKIRITVLAESGAVIEYTINVFREYAPKEVTPTEAPILTPETEHGIFELAKIDSEIYAIYSGRYKLVEPASDVMIPEGYIKTKLIISDISITAYSPKNDMESDFLLLYAENEFGESGFYKYDRLEKTLQRYVPENAKEIQAPTEDLTNDIMKSEEYRSNINKAAVVIAILSVLCALMVVVMIVMFLKLKGYKEDDLD